ncbi:hypothetical protein DM01DRAFT_1340964 [Hesseltinella vesiculosa]|uniref:Uncharacterized protein n=1 Tax=Hesseltinella vesiculosa TaxID=101127 RepID=A0A1X2G2M1_9FUNG|nr:hypothetical protein DM01DRAFT_1340964 [Hesseltinella vesiculosa]
MTLMKPIMIGALGFFLALWMILSALHYGSRFLYATLLDTTCPFIPTAMLPLIPPCAKWNDPMPNFSQLVNVQEKLVLSVLQPQQQHMTWSHSSMMDADTALTPLSLKRVELATRDLQMMIRYSSLALKDVLADKLGDYLAHSRNFGRDLQTMNAQTRGVLDNLITYNTMTLRCLSDVQDGKRSKQGLHSVYEHAMEMIEKETNRLILTIEKAQSSLSVLEADLSALHEITLQESSYQKKEQPHALADLINLAKGRELQRPLVRKNMELLMAYDNERVQASRQLLLLLDQMEIIQMDLEELRTQVVSPILMPEAITLEMHIETINKAVDRLRQGKWSFSSSPAEPLDTLD